MKYIQLTQKERYRLEFLIQEKSNQKMMAEKLGRHKSTISRELKRNRDTSGEYLAEMALELEKAVGRKKRILPTKFTEVVKEQIETRLSDGWSPEQISAHLKREYRISISHELIYQYINKDRKDGGNLYTKLPRRGNKYKKRNIKARWKIWKTAAKRRSITERPKEVALKVKLGHWEGDLVESRGHQGGIGTFVEMKSKYTIIRKVSDKSSEEMKNILIKTYSNCREVLKTMTLDNGSEFALHDIVSKELNTDIYFTNPYSPWERGLNENTNGLIRRFYPKGTDFNKVSEGELLHFQNLLNNRPRKSLNFKTPNEVFINEVVRKEEFKNIFQRV